MQRYRDVLRDPGLATPAPGRGGHGAGGVPGKATLVGATPAIALPPALRMKLERALAEMTDE